MNSFKIHNHTIGSDGCFIIAEIGQGHDGSLGTAHAYIDAVAKAGANAIKFQTHIASAESTPLEQFRINFSKEDNTRYEYWRRMEFTPSQWEGLYDHCQEVGIVFLSSPFSEQAVELLDNLGMEAWKIASGEITNLPMLQKIALTGKPILVSTGMSDMEEIKNTLTYLSQYEVPLLLFQTTTAYPCPPEKIGLNNIEAYRNTFGIPVGLSDHSGTVFTGLAAATLGIDMLETHVTFSKDMFGPDVTASITISELAYLVEGIRYIETIQNNPVNKNDISEELKPLKALFAKSIVANHNLESGHILTAEDLAFKKPGTGLAPENVMSLLGRQLNKNIETDRQLSYEDID